ncbi:DNA-binding transcriptional regulator, ArsR family [Salinibacillus kushneri]|uniref:DNA-binding transcriptional regulator, ArsR family n=1 Tax=Salinibacillus kushneri TaxID=237682 RepID=A0A1I0A4I8_9BACI|nr:metalloregulator ArsR/SmtB family transcription factor [Salinibacillus kushneri]SES89086.1 DNA-binding transcriptional regulator, ArsR family [Salinibacillus kushneri]
MDVLQLTSRKRETYNVQLTYSTLWESALGIAAITNSKLIKTLERPEEYWNHIKQLISAELLEQLNFVEKNNTWKSLLQLLHQKEFKDLSEFISYIRNLKDSEFKFICLPFVGNDFQNHREMAALGDESAIQKLIEVTGDNPFFPEYIEFISKTEVAHLKEHLINVMSKWYLEVLEQNQKDTFIILKNDYESKKTMKLKLTPEELVQWATGGVTYNPEPSVHTVLLIPQYIYRPWNIEADIEGTKVFYYPVSNESITPNDKYTPSNFLVLKHKALGDDTRLKIVKLLSERNHSLQELTEQLNVGKSTIHHHLKILRSAKLVEIIESKYSLKRDVIELLFKELEIYLKQQ